jgi:hypothetical protein
MGKLSKSKTVAPYARKCWPHPLLEVKPGMPPIAGSACRTPVVTDYDIYIGFDSMTFTDRALPWTPGMEIAFPIPDMGVPKSPENFVKLVDWTLSQMEGGAKVHAGCIGGHGRTGMFFAALVAVATGRKDAIMYVRENYCKKACETSKQIDFLVKRFGVDDAKASKGAVVFSSGSQGNWPKSPYTKQHGIDSTPGGKVIYPVSDSTTIWGDTLYAEVEEMEFENGS